MWDNVWRVWLYFRKWFPHNIFALFFRNSTQPKHGGYIFLAQPQQAARLSSSHPATRCCFLLFLLLSFHPLQSVNLNVKGWFEVKTWRAPPAAAVPLSSAATMSMTFLWLTAAWLSFTQTDQRWPFESRETSQLEKSRGKGTLSMMSHFHGSTGGGNEPRYAATCQQRKEGRRLFAATRGWKQCRCQTF